MTLMVIRFLCYRLDMLDRKQHISLHEMITYTQTTIEICIHPDLHRFNVYVRISKSLEV